MDVVIVGGGEIGMLLGEALQHSNNVTVLDIDAEKANNFSNLDVQFLVGSGSDPKDLQTVKADKADAFIACTSNDDINVLACLAAKGLGAKKTLAFVTRQRYLQAFAEQGPMESVGLVIDRMLWPQSLLAKQIVDIVRVPRAVETAFFANGKIKLVEYKLAEDDPYVGMSLLEASLPESVLMVGSIRDYVFEVPSGNTLLHVGDKVVFMGITTAMKALESHFAPKRHKLKISIIGGGNVGAMVAEQLQHDRGVRLTVLEQDEPRCEKLAQRLSRVLVLKGDGTDLELLEQERLDETDVLVAVTDDDSKNLLISLLGKHLGIPKVITRIGRAKNRRLFEKVGIDSLLTPRSAAVQDVLNWLELDEVDHLASIEGRAEVVEVTYPQYCCSGKIKDLGTPPKSLIGAILRDSQVIIPSGETDIKENDHLYIVTTPDNVEAVHTWLEQKRKGK